MYVMSNCNSFSLRWHVFRFVFHMFRCCVQSVVKTDAPQQFQLLLWSTQLCNKWNRGTYFWLTLNLLCCVCVHLPPILLPWWPISHTFSIMINPEHGIQSLVNHSPPLPAPWVFTFLHRIIYRQSWELSAKPQPPLLLRVSMLYLWNQRICVVLSIKHVHSISCDVMELILWFILKP